MRKREYNLKLHGVAAAMISLGSVLSVPAFAVKVIDQGDLSVNVDTTLSAGVAWRASDINPLNVGQANSANTLDSTKHHPDTASQDNSDLKWAKGKPFSEITKGTVDVQTEYKNYGAFVRGRFFYDNAIIRGDGATMQPEYYIKDSVTGKPTEPDQTDGRGAKLLDAFVWGNWQMMDMPLNVRLGSQVLNWGEGVLFPNGINTVNPIDVNALLAPGAEIKEALIPVKMVHASLGVTDTMSVEAFYQFEWKKTLIPDCGTFFNTSDLAGDSCLGGFYALGLEQGQPGAQNYYLPYNGKDMYPDNGDEFGFAARYYVESIQTELGGYYIHYSSRLPIVSGIAPAADKRNSITERLNNASFLLEYPEGIDLLGASFNTNLDLGLPGGGTAVSGEISYRKNQPMQIEDSVLVTGLVGWKSQLCADTNFSCDAMYPNDQFISGAIKRDFYQGELAFIQFFDQIVGADRVTMLLDLAYNYADIPDKSELLMNSGYNASATPAYGPIADPKGASKYYPTRASYGYKMRVSAEYSNVFAGVNLVPAINFSHDVKGVTPGPVSNFLQNRKSLGMSLEANYLNAYKVEASYTNFYGAEPYNQLNDRDYYALSASVSF